MTHKISGIYAKTLIIVNNSALKIEWIFTIFRVLRGKILHQMTLIVFLG
jgi:hypothetical protein